MLTQSFASDTLDIGKFPQRNSFHKSLFNINKLFSKVTDFTSLCVFQKLGNFKL